MEGRKKLRVGIPRVLNIYTYAPLFNGYLESLGVQPENIIYSDYTSSDLYRAGASRGAIDPCFPAKIGISHVYNLIQEKHRKKPLDVIFFPMYDVLTSPLVKIVGANACPTVTATPETVKAAFTKENDVFAENNVKYVDPSPQFCRPQTVRASDAAGLAADPGPVEGRKRSRCRSRLQGLSGLRNQASASARARCSINWSAKTASAS